jgi:hypothetical protein
MHGLGGKCRRRTLGSAVTKEILGSRATATHSQSHAVQPDAKTKWNNRRDNGLAPAPPEFRSAGNLLWLIEHQRSLTNQSHQDVLQFRSP